MATEKDPNQDAAQNRGKRAVPGVGEVSGSGAGAGGGGNPEDYDDDPVAGGGPSQTGKSGKRAG